MGDNSMEDTCFVFLDDSNIWIEAQKFAASGNSHLPKLKDRNSDPRLRIDIGSLVNVLCRGRGKGRLILYGSRPPPNDKVWKAFGEHNFETKIYDRVRGKEKQVDTAMATDISGIATELSVEARFDPEAKRRKRSTVFVAVTGDRDMLPPLEAAMKCGIRVELWAWKSGIANVFKKASAHNDMLSANALDDVFKYISFSVFRSTRRTGVDPAHAIVIISKLVGATGEELEDFIASKFLLLGRLFYVTPTETDKEIYVEFPEVKNMDGLIHGLRQYFKKEDEITILSWPEYRAQVPGQPPDIPDTSYSYEPLGEENGRPSHDIAAETPQSVQGMSSATEPKGGLKEVEQWQQEGGAGIPELDKLDDDMGWTPVSRSNPTKSHHRVLRHASACQYGIRCAKKGDCGYRHTDEERNLFRDNPNQNFRYWKSRKCNRDPCFHGKRCRFAHTQEEAWCLVCRVNGHYSEECRWAK